MRTYTQVKSYHELLENGKIGKQMKQVLYTLAGAGCGPVTRREIMHMTGLEMCAVCGRVNALLKIGALLPSGNTKDPDTGKTVQLVILNGGA